MSAFAGVRGTGKWGVDERPKNFRSGIMWLNPNGTAPIFALSSKMGKRTVDDPEYSWWNEPNNLVRLQVNGAVTAPATGSSETVAVDSTDPSAAALSAHWGTALNLVPGDLLMVEPSADSATFDHQILRVDTVSSATSFTALFGQAATTAADLVDDAYLLKIGNVFMEGSRSPASASSNPIKYYNFTQIFSR